MMILPMLLLTLLLFFTHTTQAEAPKNHNPEKPNQSTLAAKEHGCERLYDSDPGHLWNRLYETLFIRRTPEGMVWGCDTSDPLFWRDSTYLFEGKAYKDAIAKLDEFIESRGERLSKDPVKKALLQRDILQLFAAMTHPANDQFKETSHAKERMALQKRLALVIRRLALSESERKKLPSNFDAAIQAKSFLEAYDPRQPEKRFLPPRLFDPSGPWALLEDNTKLLASTHDEDYNGRSHFSIYVNFPGGKANLEKYLENVNTNRGSQVPAGTQFAIVRKAILVDSEGKPYVSPLVEFVRMTVQKQTTKNDSSKTPLFHEVTLSKKQLLAGKGGGLRSVDPEEFSFPALVLRSYGVDQLSDKKHQEAARTGGPYAVEGDKRFGPYGSWKQNCASCHGGGTPNIFEMPEAKAVTIQTERNHEDNTLQLNRYSWGVLRTMMAIEP